MAASKGGQPFGKAVRSDGGNYAENDATALIAGHLADFHYGIADVAQDSFGARKKCAAKRRQAGFTAQAVKEACTKLVFELEDLLEERGLGHADLRRAAGEIAAASHGQEITELVKFHIADDFMKRRIF